MRVVNYVRAAEMAGVSKQAIYSMKKANTLQKGKYPFFIHSPETGKPGVDIENPSWLDYLNRNQRIRVKSKQEKPQTESTKRQDKSGESDNSAGLSTLIGILFSIAQEVFQADDETMTEYKQRVIEAYRGTNE